jgi:hypothetical protein
MIFSHDRDTRYIAPWTRVVIMLAALGLMLLVARLLTGSFIPENSYDALIFQNGLLLIVLGSAIIEYKYTKPADSVVNALAGMITLITVYALAPKMPWWAVFLYCLLVFVIASICTIASTGRHIVGPRRKVANMTYTPAVFFGSARLLFSIVFLYGLFTFYGLQSIQTVTLVLFWGFYIAIWPLGVAEFLSGLRQASTRSDPIGRVIRIDSPGIVRTSLDPTTSWTPSSPKVFRRLDGKQSLLIPLYSQLQGDQIVGTGLVAATLEIYAAQLDRGFVYEPPEDMEITDSIISESLGGGTTSRLVGFVIEDSTISDIRFETWDEHACREGMIVWCRLGDRRVYYQITNGTTREESFHENRHGFQFASAAQLGYLGDIRGFVKHPWLPNMNTAVFSEAEDFGEHVRLAAEGDFVYGTLPGTQIEVGGPFIQFVDHHTAILGVTGSGKTELAFDMLRHTVGKGLKVVCIDLTAKYEARLADLKPTNLSLTRELSAELGGKLFDAETGQYGAGREKKALRQFAANIRDDISNSIENFLKSEEDDARVGLIMLEEISNTKATLYITELYLTCLLNYAREHPDDCPRILIVVEEAHTVMPEPNTMGLGDYDSRGLVSKIAQIALQGRKYGVGLLVIAQRTATVSKSVLTQCNTVISFSCFDDTSLKFLSNIFGSTHVSLIPNLPFLHAVVYGKCLRSERPLIIEIPFDDSKA